MMIFRMQTKPVLLVFLLLIAVCGGVTVQAETIRGIRLPDGALLTQPDGAFTPKEGLALLRKQSHALLEQKAPRRAIDPSVHQLEFLVAANPSGTSFAEICDAYITNYIVPTLRPMPARIKTLEVLLTSKGRRKPQSCKYSVRNKEQLFKPGTRSNLLFPSSGYTEIPIAGHGKIPVKRLFDTSLISTPGTRHFYLAVSHEAPTSDRFLPVIHATAEALYRRVDSDAKRNAIKQT
jgi:hypothetical protein